MPSGCFGGNVHIPSGRKVVNQPSEAIAIAGSRQTPKENQEKFLEPPFEADPEHRKVVAGAKSCETPRWWGNTRVAAYINGLFLYALRRGQPPPRGLLKPVWFSK